MNAKPGPQFTPEVASGLAALAHKLAHDPKTRKQYAKLVKEVAPEHAGAFSDVESADALDAFKQELLDRDTATAAAATVARLAADRAKLLENGDDGKPRYTEDQVKAIEGVMQRLGLSDYEAGRVIYAHENPPANPTPATPDNVSGATFEFPTLGGLSFADFAADPTKAARTQAYEVIGEFARKRGR
jgi:hypothetical protein